MKTGREISCRHCGTKAMEGFICPECGRYAEEKPLTTEDSIINAIRLIVSDYNNGDTSSNDAHELLTELNRTAFNLVRFKACTDLDTEKIQGRIHAAQDIIQ